MINDMIDVKFVAFLTMRFNSRPFAHFCEINFSMQFSVGADLQQSQAFLQRYHIHILVMNVLKFRYEQKKWTTSPTPQISISNYE
jgi:hypothetical protein